MVSARDVFFLQSASTCAGWHKCLSTVPAGAQATDCHFEQQLISSRHFFFRFLRQPGNRFHRPYALGILRAQVFRNSAKNRVIVRRLVMRYRSPIHRARGGMRLAEASDDVVVPVFRLGKFLAYERYSTKAALESS